MQTTKFTITLGARGYNFNVPSKEFLAYLNDDISKLTTDNGNIEIPQFINLYLKKSYSHFQLLNELKRLDNENIELKAKLKKQEEDLMQIINNLNKGDLK